jgi:hypothetical protein
MLSPQLDRVTSVFLQHNMMLCGEKRHIYLPQLPFSVFSADFGGSKRKLVIFLRRYLHPTHPDQKLFQTAVGNIRLWKIRYTDSATWDWFNGFSS